MGDSPKGAEDTTCFILWLHLTLGKEQNVPVCCDGSNFSPPRFSQQGTDKAPWNKALFSQGVEHFALVIIHHVLRLLWLRSVSCIPREVSFIMPILQVVTGGSWIDFRHVLQITTKVVLIRASLILMIPLALQLVSQSLPWDGGWSSLTCKSSAFTSVF